MVKSLVSAVFLFIGVLTFAQQKCSIENYIKEEIKESPSYKNRLDEIEKFIRLKTDPGNQARTANTLNTSIKIPVVIHVLYHLPQENISENQILNMMNSLNRDFAKKNFDTLNTPANFKPYASDLGFEFKLATMDPRAIGTTGIVRKYTPVKYWLSDDRMKFNAAYGDDAWDTKSYLNIWICNMQDVLGYSTFPGIDALKDGIVISVDNFYNTRGTTPGKNDCRTIVHEVGHWLNLKHLWGDGFCGDDGVADTPQQSTYTPGCPSGNRISCNNAQSGGDMYMNYMDFTDDVCMNMFTKGQKDRARALFLTGGPRNSILNSKGLNISQVQAAPAPDFYPEWMYARVYPNPATTILNIYFEFDERWIGNEIKVLDMTGREVLRKVISNKIQHIDISRLNAGVYFLVAQKEYEKIRTKFVKQ